MYTITYSDQAAKTVRKLPKKERDALLKKTEELRANPFPFLKRLKNSKFWRLRVGKHRAVVDIIVIKKKIFVISIGKRDSVYDS